MYQIESGAQARITLDIAREVGEFHPVVSDRGSAGYGVCLQAGAIGDEVDAALYGVFGDLPKVAGSAVAKGDRAYLHTTLAALTGKPIGPCVGYFNADAASGDTLCDAFIDGTSIRQERIQLSGVFDATGGKAIGTHVVPGMQIPAGFNIARARYRVHTTFADGVDDSATIAILESDGGSTIVAANDIADVGDPWDSGGWVDGTQDGDSANISTTTPSASRNVTVVVAVKALTVGKMQIVVDLIPGIV